MTRGRYEELLTAGPVITAEDYKRLRSLAPVMSQITYYVWLAMVRPNMPVAP